MSRIVFLVVALLTLVIMTLASPINVSNATISNATSTTFEKRLTHTGRGTYFYPGHGHCGNWNGNNDPIVAISIQRYRANNGANCGQWMEIVNTRNGKKAYGVTQDTCESCGWDDIDMSPSLFKKLDALDRGTITAEWHFKGKNWHP